VNGKVGANKVPQVASQQRPGFGQEQPFASGSRCSFPFLLSFFRSCGIPALMLQATEHGHRSFPRTQSEQTLSAFSSRRRPRGSCQSPFVVIYSWTLLYDVSLVAQAELEQTCLARASPMQSQSRKSTHQEAKTVNPETSILQGPPDR
jgi:hypothetical protein